MSSNTRKWLVTVVCVACAGVVWATYNYTIAADCDSGTDPTGKGGKPLADAHMAQWKLKNPGRANDWIKEEKERHKIQPPADNSDLLKGDQGKGHAYGNYTERDILMWARETEKLVVEGSRVFHSADLLGGTIGVSCDMCHPDAANTHPETYPKFQPQMGRAALLRDMINWCIEHPVRGKAMAADDARMRALEAYIFAQRKGVKLNYGKH
jgi:thiosulfate dehydrogenase